MIVGDVSQMLVTVADTVPGLSVVEETLGSTRFPPCVALPAPGY